MTSSIAGPDPTPEAILQALPQGACDCHAHIFGPSDRFPYAEGRGYTPPDAPVESYLALLDALGCDRGVVVQGNAHGYDNRAILDALSHAPQRLRGVAITDARATAANLRSWHEAGMRGLRFHIFHPDRQPGYVRGVGLDVFEHFRPVMRALGWHMQVWCDWRVLPELDPILRSIGADMPVVIDHMAEFDASLGVADPRFATLERLVGDGVCWVKLSGAYRCSKLYPDYDDVAAIQRALVRANPERLLWGTDWPHTSIPAEVMPNDGRLLNLMQAWSPDAAVRQRILVDNPALLYGFDRS
ncbi:MAG: amidohydrolase family protein [Acetobacteraceae bacterium]